ncbi:MULTISPECIES: ComF family protein [Clostridium]|uniref:ComF family protein n=1 Tax=Clostridium TaxID=1485 RepID=UPI002256C26E|nr:MULTISPECIES: hypothetical protein [Clostridium]UZT07753.1 hypothetical protein ONV75_07785 [Clostridium sp. LQ25]
MKINPLELRGNWTKGYALDYHTISSEYLGEDEYGHAQFDTRRSDIGELLYQFKYKNNYSKLNEIIELITPFIEQFTLCNPVDVIIPVPPSNTNRKYQPVYELSKAIGDIINKSVAYDFLSKCNNTQLKGLGIEEKKNAISGSVIRNKCFLVKRNVLIIDDLYQTGTTLNEISNLLKEEEANINNIYVITMTKTRR